MIPLQLNNIILGLQKGNQLAYDQDLSSFINLGRSKPEKNQRTDLKLLMEKINEFVIINHSTITEPQKTKIKSLVENKITFFRSIQNCFLKMIGFIFSAVLLKSVRDEDQSIHNVIETLKKPLTTTVNVINELTTRILNPIPKETTITVIPPKSNEGNSNAINPIVLPPVVNHISIITPQPPTTNRVLNFDAINVSKETGPNVGSSKPPVNVNTLNSPPLNFRQITKPLPMPTISEDIVTNTFASNLLSTPPRNKINVNRKSIINMTPRQPKLGVVAPPPPPTFEVLRFKDEPEPLQFDWGPQGYEGIPKEEIEKQIKQIETYIQALQKAIEPVKLNLDRYNGLKKSLESNKAELKKIEQEKTKYETSLFQISQIEKDNQPRFFQLGPSLFPVFSDQRIEQIKKRHKELESEKKLKMTALANEISKLEKENSHPEQKTQLQEKKNQLEHLQNIPSFDISSLFSSLTVSDAKRKIQAIQNSFSEWEDPANDYCEQIVEDEQELTKIKQLKNNGVPFDQFEDLYKQKIAEINKWSSFKVNREKYLKKKEAPIAIEATTAKPQGENPLLVEFPELRHIENMDKKLRPILSLNTGDEQGIWKDAFYVAQ